MAIPASETEVSEVQTEWLRRERERIVSIYRQLFPDDDLEFVLFQGENPVWSDVKLHDEPITFQPQHLATGYLGQVRDVSGQAGARRRLISLAVPRAPLPGEVQRSDAPWRPFRGMGRLFQAWPMGYEHIRWRAEMRRKRLCAKRHSHQSLPFGKGSNTLPVPQDTGPDTSQRPAILIGFHWLEVGGAEKLAFDCVNWALAAGLRVFVVAAVPSLQRLANRLPDHPDISFIRLDRYLSHDLWPQFLANLARAENIRLVHIHHCVPIYEALPHLRVRAPWVEVIDSTHIVEYSDGGYPRISGVWSNYIDHHHVISGALADYYRDRFHVMGKVRLGRMLPRDQIEPPALNMQPGQKHLHVAFIGRMYYQKRPVVVVQILRRIAQWAMRHGVEFSATLVGEGPFEDTVAELLNRYRLADRVQRQAAGADIPGLLARSDILLLPSNNEGLALVCYEAIQHGCIPLATDVGAQAELLPHELLLPHEPFACVSDALRALDRLWQDSGFLERQKRQLHEHYKQIASDPTAEEVLMPIYRAAAEIGVA